MANKKKVSNTQKKLQNKIYYLNKKNKLIANEFNNFNSEDFYKINSKKVKENFKGYIFKQKDKVKGSTLINILRNKIKDNNTIYDKTFKHLKNKFKKNIKGKKPKPNSKVKGIYVSVEFTAWESSICFELIQRVAFGDKNLAQYIFEANKEFFKMGNYDVCQFTYDKKNKIFDIFIIENSK